MPSIQVVPLPIDLIRKGAPLLNRYSGKVTTSVQSILSITTPRLLSTIPNVLDQRPAIHNLSLLKFSLYKYKYNSSLEMQQQQQQHAEQIHVPFLMFQFLKKFQRSRMNAQMKGATYGLHVWCSSVGSFVLLMDHTCGVVLLDHLRPLLGIDCLRSFQCYSNTVQTLLCDVPCIKSECCSLITMCTVFVLHF